MTQNIHRTIKSNSGTLKSFSPKTCLEKKGLPSTRWTGDCKTAPRLRTAGYRLAVTLIRRE